MADIKTKFAGLELRSPIIAASCGLTADIKMLQEMDRYGVGAVVLKSIFEEQVRMETEKIMGESAVPAQEDYIRNYIRANTLQQYIDLIRQVKEKLSVPVIASINCIEDGEWVRFARRVEEAGADALELNIYVMPVDEFRESADVENIYFEMVKHVRAEVKIPIVVKLSHFFTGIPAFVDKLIGYGADAVTLFNRLYSPDIDVEREVMTAASVFSMPTDMRIPLRWTGILAGKDPRLQISASTGIHGGEAVVKMLLAGATTVQICSELYKSGPAVIQTMNEYLSSWMDRKFYRSIDQFRGKLSYADVENASRYERAQFMKYFSDRQE